MDVKEFLKSLPALNGLEDADIERLARHAKAKNVPTGQMVDVQGEPAKSFYIVVTGRLSVTLDLDFGVSKKSYIVTSIGPGEMFAWSGMVGNLKYTAGSRTMTDCSVLAFDTAELEKEFAEDPRLGYVVMKAVARTIASRLRHMQLQFVKESAIHESGE